MPREYVELSSVADYDFTKEDTESRVATHLQVVDQTIAQFFAFKEDVSSLGTYKVEQKELAKKTATNTQHIEVELVREQLQVLEELLQKIRESSDVIRTTEVKDLSYNVFTEALELQKRYIEQEALFQATLAELKRQNAEKEQIVYAKLVHTLEQHGKRVLKGSILSWLVDKNGIVPPYDTYPDNLSVQVQQLKMIVEKFRDTSTVVGKIRGMFPANNTAAVELQSILNEVLSVDQMKRELQSSTLYVPGWQDDASDTLILQNTYLFKVRQAIGELCAADTQSDKFIDLYDGIYGRLSPKQTYGEYDLAISERRETGLKALFGDSPTEEAKHLYSDVANASDYAFYSTHDKLIRSAQRKVVEAWEAAHADTYNEYRNRLVKLEEGRDQKDYSRVASIITAHNTEETKHAEKDAADSLEFVEFFKQRFPIEAQLLKNEIAEIEQAEREKIRSKLTVSKEKRLGDSVVHLQEAIDVLSLDQFELHNLFERMMVLPQKEYYSLAVRLLKKLNTATSYSGGRDSYKRLIMLALASKTQLSPDDLPQSYIKIWSSFIDAHATGEEVRFLEAISRYNGRDFDQVLDERHSFFVQLDKNNGNFNFLVSLSASSRLEQYKMILENVEKDTLIAETLLRHEQSFEDTSNEAVLYLLEVMDNNRANQDKKCKENVPPPQIIDFVLTHTDINQKHREVISMFYEVNERTCTALSLHLYRTVCRGESIDSVVNQIQMYLEALNHCTEQQLMRVVVDKLTDVLPDRDSLQELLLSATQAMNQDTIDAWFLRAQKKFRVKTEDIFIPITAFELKDHYESVDVDSFSTLTAENWTNNLFTYIQIEADLGYVAEPNADIKKHVIELFKSDDVKTQCFEYLHSLWLEYLEKDDEESFPYELAKVTEFVNYHMGAGALKYVTSLSNFAFALRESYIRKTTAEVTSKETYVQVKNLEKRFVEEKWSQKEVADFYDISADLIENAPSLFTQFLQLFNKLGKSAFTQFSKENYPLFQARVAIINVAAESNKEKRKLVPREFVAIRRELKEMELRIQTQEDTRDILATSKKVSLEDVRQRFQEAFSIIKVPEEISKEHIRTIQNNARYLANINEKTENYQEKLAFFLALMLNGKWNEFRSNQPIDPGEFFSQDSRQLDILQKYLQKRQELQQPIQDKLGFDQEEMSEFWQLLNTQESLFSVMNVRSVDVKLQEILLSLEELNDPDAYDEEIEKNMLPVYIKYGVATVNRVISQSFVELSGREVRFENDGDTQVFAAVQEAVRGALAQSGREWTSQSIKELQVEMKMISSIQKTYASIHEQGIPQAINDLQRALLPSTRVVELFQKIGEDFSTESGAIALSQDIDFLENSLVKRGEKLTTEEKAEIVVYLSTIREQLGLLEAEYNKIKQRFSQLSQSMHTTSPVLQERIAQVSKVIHQTNEEKEYTSIFTNDMNVIIENIRACLGCLQKEVNNDTNLAFGDANKFFLMTKNSELESSMSDQIVLLEPVVHVDGTSEISLIFDRLYGIRSADIFMNHVALIWKRYLAIKRRFPNSAISVFVSDAALSTAGVTHEVFFKKIEETIGNHQALGVTDSSVNVLESAGSDPYVEFGGESRVHGERTVSGIVLRLPT